MFAHLVTNTQSLVNWRLSETDLSSNHNNMHLIREHLRVTTFSGRNPAFIFFLLSQHFTHEFFTFSSKLHDITLTSKDFVYASYSGETFMINQIESETRRFDFLIPIKYPNSNKNPLLLSYLNTFWFKVHKYLGYGHGEICCETPGANFIIEELTDSLNFSRTELEYCPDSLSQKPLYSHDISKHFFKNKAERWHWTLYENFIEHFAFTVFANRMKNDPIVLLKPFYSLTWILILASIFSVSLLT